METVGPQRAILIMAIAPLFMALGATLSDTIRNARPIAHLKSA
jgi:hypothetical protein